VHQPASDQFSTPKKKFNSEKQTKPFKEKRATGKDPSQCAIRKFPVDIGPGSCFDLSLKATRKRFRFKKIKRENNRQDRSVRGSLWPQTVYLRGPGDECRISDLMTITWLPWQRTKA
jgi:hypothetical protein